MRVDVGIDGAPQGSPTPRKLIKNLKHLKQLLIDKNLPEKIYKEVYGKARKYPEGSLDFFWNNVDNHVTSAINKLRKELGEEFVVEPPVRYNLDRPVEAAPEKPETKPKPVKK